MNRKRLGSMFMGRRLAGNLAVSLLWVPVLAQDGARPGPLLKSMAGINRLCVEKFGGEESLATEAKGATIAAVFAMKRYIVTENCDKADAILKGSVSEKIAQRARGESEGMSF